MSNETHIPTDPPEYPIPNCYSMSVPRAVYSAEESTQLQEAFRKAAAIALAGGTSPEHPTTGQSPGQS